MGSYRREDEAAGSYAAPLAPLGPAGPPSYESGASPPGLFSQLPLYLQLAILAPVVAVLGLAATLGAMFLYFTISFPDPLAMRPKERGPVVRLLAYDGSLLAERGASRDYVPLDLLPRRVSDAVVATEDRRFYEHWGLDPMGLVRAVFANLRAGRFAQGGSTVTQQLAKNLFLTPERTLARKVEELVLAFWLELRLSKGDILELYLNRVYFGGGAYGIEAAAQRYFGKSARDLSLAEAAVIAGLLKAPSKYAPSASPQQALARGRSVLQKMREAGFITEAQEQEAANARVTFSSATQKAEPGGTDYAVDFILEGLAAVVGVATEELVVETTVDASLQRRANEIVQRAIGEEGAALAASQAALVVLDPDGGIRALVGGRSYAESQFNRAVKARRQPGSAFKPVVYLAALEAGFTPDSIVYDEPLFVAGWAPRNDNGRYVGPVTLRDALAHSINSVAVRLILNIGAGKVASVARRLGIKSKLRRDASLALGTSEVSLLELAGAYGAFASGGRAIAPYAIRRVRTSSGKVLFAQPEPEQTQAVAPAHVAAMNDMLRATLLSGTGRRAALPLYPAAGKTGTSQEFRDAWFVGFTTHFTAGVWVGNDNGRAMDRVKGGSLPADIWRQVMMAAHVGKEPLALPGLGGPEATGGHPDRPIDDDFVARATADATFGVKGPPATLASPVVEQPMQRIIVRPPPGLMSLGGRRP